jgi:hypothetical protein
MVLPERFQLLECLLLKLDGDLRVVIFTAENITLLFLLSIIEKIAKKYFTSRLFLLINVLEKSNESFLPPLLAKPLEEPEAHLWHR